MMNAECGMWNEEWASGFWLLAVVDNRQPLLCFRRLRIASFRGGGTAMTSSVNTANGQ